MDATSIYDMNVVAVSDQALLLGAGDADIEMFDKLNEMDYNITSDNTFVYDTSLSGDVYYLHNELPVFAPPPQHNTSGGGSVLSVSMIGGIVGMSAVLVGIIIMFVHSKYMSKKRPDTQPERLTFCENPLHK